MTKPRRRFPWSDAQLRKATAPRALPYYDDEDRKVRDDLVEEGTQQVTARRRGGQTRRSASVRAEIRRIVLAGNYRCVISPRLQKYPTGAATIARLRDFLARCGFDVDEGTVRRDVQRIGTGNLRP